MLSEWVSKWVNACYLNNPNNDMLGKKRRKKYLLTLNFTLKISFVEGNCSSGTNSVGRERVNFHIKQQSLKW